MSSQGMQGGSGDKLSADKPEAPRLSTTHILPQGQHADLLKVAAGRVTAPNRPIAPAMAPGGMSLAGHVTMTGAQLVAGPHNLMAKVAGGSLEPMAATLTSVPGASGHSVTLTPGGGQSTIMAHPIQVPVTIPTPTAVSLQGAGTGGSTSLVQQGLPVQMSLIRGGALSQAMVQQAALTQGLAPGTTQIHTQQQAQQPAVSTHHPQTSTPILFPAHIPRGAAAASALVAPKPGTMATAALRQATPVHIPITSGVSPAPVIPNLLQPRALLPVRPGAATTPPVTRPGSPAISIPTAGEPHRQGGHPSATTSATTVQITIQQQAGKAMGEMGSRAVAHLAHPKTSQQLASSPQIPQINKVVMSQATASPIIHPTAGPTTVPKLRHGQPYSLGPAMNRPQKIVVSQAALHATAVQGTKGIVTVPGPKKIVVTQPSGLSGIHPASSNQPAKVTALNLSQSLGRPPKMVVSQMVPKPVTPSTVLPAGMSAASVVSTISATQPISTVTSIPIAKLQQAHHRHLVQQHPSPGQALQDFTSGRGEGVAGTQSPGVPGHPLPVSAVSGGPQGSGLFIPQPGHRASPNTAPTTTAISTPHTDARTDRPNLPFSPYGYPFYQGPGATPAQIVNYQTSLPERTFTTIANPSNLQPALKLSAPSVPSQTPNLAQSLQQAAHGVSMGGAGGSPAVRPVMLAVDPNTRHQGLALHPQFNPANDPKFAASSDSVTTNISTSLFSGGSVTSGQQPGMQGMSGGQPPPPTTSSNNNQSLTASPRPSILRKRTNDGIAAVKKNLMASESSPVTETASQISQIAPATSPKPSIHDPSRENSQSSTDTATSNESTPKSGATPELKIKQEPLDVLENGPSAGSQSSLQNSGEASPRKKPRKQLLHANEEIKDRLSTDEEVEKISAKVDLKKEIEKMAVTIKKEELTEFVDEEGVRWVAEKRRPNISLMNHYSCTWKPRNNHFLKYTDVKPKEERRPTVNELANQRGVVQKASGWKLYHLAAQLEDIHDLEKDALTKMSELQEAIAPKHIAKHTIEDDIGMVHELTQGNIQRCKYTMDQLDEAKAAMIKILDHKKRIMEIITKHHSKRPVKKKERV